MLKRRTALTLIMLIAMLTLFSMSAATIARAEAEETAQTARIWTDKPDYAPEETVKIFGTGFLPDSTILIQVTRPDSTVDSWSTTSNSSGNFVTTYQLDGILGEYTVTATDGTNTATTTFTDKRPLQFKETGLPSGTLWNVTVEGMFPETKSSTGDTISFGNVDEGTSWPFSVGSPISGGTGIRYTASPSSGTVSVPSGSGPVTTYITFTTQYQVSFAVSPSGSGTTSPSETSWYNSGTIISISAIPNVGYVFSSWSTSTSSIIITNPSSASTTAKINGPGTITANFQRATVEITVTSSPEG